MEGVTLSPEGDAQESIRTMGEMAQLFGLNQGQVARIRPFFPKEQGVKREDAPAPTKPSTTVAAAGQTRVFLV